MIAIKSYTGATIIVRKDTHQKLLFMKIKCKAKSLDDVIRKLIRDAR